MVTEEFDEFSPAALTALQKDEEDLHVEWKRSVNDVKSSYLVAFANSLGGGTILAGVEDDGKINGCTYSDREKQVLVSRAGSCHPPVDFSVFLENTSSDRSFVRIVVPESPNKPHCTGKGTYYIREDGQNAPLVPTDLLTIFAEREEGQFLNRFKNATVELESNLKAIHELVAQYERQLKDIEFAGTENFAHLERLVQQLDGVEELVAYEFDRKMPPVVHLLKEVLHKVSRYESRYEQLEKRLTDLSDNSEETTQFLLSLIGQLDLEHPYKIQERDGFRESMKLVKSILTARGEDTSFDNFLVVWAEDFDSNFRYHCIEDFRECWEGLADDDVLDIDLPAKSSPQADDSD